MHIDDLVHVAKRKLAAVGIQERPLRIRTEEPGAFFGVQDPLRFEPEDTGEPCLIIQNYTSYRDAALERILEHRAAKYIERIEQGPTHVFGSRDPSITCLQVHMRDAYQEYTAGKRMIEEFGQYAYDAYQESSAPGLCDAVHDQWRRHSAPADRFALITYFLREHAKDVLATSQDLTPPVIGQMVPALQKVFTYIRSLHVPSIDDKAGRTAASILRSRLLTLPGAHLVEHVDVLKSYESGMLQMNKDGDLDVTTRYKTPLSDEGKIHAATVQRYILQGYGLMPADAPKIKTFLLRSEYPTIPFTN